MNIRPSAAIGQNANEIAEMGKKLRVYLSNKNRSRWFGCYGYRTFNCREQILKLCDELLVLEEDRIAGNIEGTLEELDEHITFYGTIKLRCGKV